MLCGFTVYTIARRLAVFNYGIRDVDTSFIYDRITSVKWAALSCFLFPKLLIQPLLEQSKTSVIFI